MREQAQDTQTARDTAAAEGHSLRVTRVVPASPARVFAAWTEAPHLRRWSCPEGVEVSDAEVDLRVGGAYRILMRGPEGERYTAFGTYREIQPPRRLVYTWDWEEKEHAVGETVVTVEFVDRGAATEVIVTHEGFGADEAAAGHEEGWTSCLNRLEGYLAAPDD
ncbi:MAG TPA: SRPBCC domain-containing protein [Longimicrobiales bacterium]|nr:SRPBCC domain-containing protein [Longimicrobiales bacterium]